MRSRHSDPGHVTSFDEDGQGFAKMKDFGFHGSLEGGDAGHPLKGHREPGKPASGHGSTNPIQSEPEGFGGGGYAEGGHHPHGHDVHHVEAGVDGSVTHHHAHGGYTTHHMDGEITHHTADGGMAEGGSAHCYAPGGLVNAHPHGHAVTRVESSHGMPDREIHRHAHGGFTVHYNDGREPTHHTEDGTPAYHAGGTAGEYAGGGHADAAQDKQLFKKMMTEHEKGEGEAHMARGGIPGLGMPSMRPHKPKMMRKPKLPPIQPVGGGALSKEMPINRPPRNPERSVSPRNQMPGGVMPYGVQPSAEPDVSQGTLGAGSPGTGASGAGGLMRRGGRAGHRME
jgi:hypothetical protein